MAATITCIECDCETDVAFDLKSGKLDVACPYCGAAMNPMEVLVGNIILARNETRELAKACAAALKAFAYVIRHDAPAAPPAVPLILNQVADIVRGPAEAFR